MLETLRKLREGILDILLPRFCVGCGREGDYICDKCEIFFSEVDPAYLPKVNDVHLREVQNVMSIWQYEGLMEKLIHEIKYRGKYHIIDELVEKALKKNLEFGIWNLEFPANTYITYVPMRPQNEKERGFNQAELIAHKLGLVLSRTKHKPIEVLPLLVKIKDNRSQVGLTPTERLENVKGVFEFLGPLAPKNVLLVDDVYTTGATAKECVRVLRKAGVKNVWVFTIARKLTI